MKTPKEIYKAFKKYQSNNFEISEDILSKLEFYDAFFNSQWEGKVSEKIAIEIDSIIS